MNQTQGLGNVSYSIAHKEILEKADRERVAKQLLTIIQAKLGKKNLSSYKILDVGCSSGVITQAIAKQSKNTIGIDVDENAIKKAILNYAGIKNVSFKVAEGGAMPFKDNSFDIVFCNQVYSYVSNPNKMMKEIHRVLGGNGICLFTGDNILRPIEPLYKLPFIRLLPKNLTKLILKITGHNSFYIGSYKNFWDLKEMCSDFAIDDFTLKVIREPGKYKFKKLLRYKIVVKTIPNFALKLIEPFLPTFIFVLNKV